MWPAIIAAAAGTAQGIGNLWSGNKAARKAWSHAKEAAQNAHQWEVGDLRAAGLNPVLSATGGSGATAQPFMATTPAVDAVSSAEKGMATAKARADMQNAKAVTDAQVAQLNAGTAKMYNDMTNDTFRLQNETNLAQSTIGLNSSHVGLNNANALFTGANTGLVKAKTAQIPILNNLYVAQKGAANAAAAASYASAAQANENAYGLRMTNRYYAEDPSRIRDREMARTYGMPIGIAAGALTGANRLFGPNGSVTNWFKGATDHSAKSGVGGW